MPPKDITEIDSNFTSKKIGDIELDFCSVASEACELSGLHWFKEEQEFCRLPQNIVSKVNEGVTVLAWHTSGVQVRFRSNTGAIAITAELLGPVDMPHMPSTGSSGFDVYIGVGPEKNFIKNVCPAVGETSLEGIYSEFNSREEREYTIYFPLYNGVKNVHIGVEPGYKIEQPTPFAIEKPIVFYGSSITQGGCASRPGNAYSNFLSRWLDVETLNFGFSGSGRGEMNIAELLATLDAAAFVLDYDHNAPDVPHLQETHEPFFKKLRDAHPDMPIVMVSRPDNSDKPDALPRREVIQRTYENARSAGDTNVYYIDGSTLFGQTDRDACTVDGCHPNDLGFLRMAETIYPVLKQALKR